MKLLLWDNPLEPQPEPGGFLNLVIRGLRKDGCKSRPASLGGKPIGLRQEKLVAWP